MLVVVAQLISLFFGIWFTEVNLMKAFRGHRVTANNLIVQASSLTVFIYLTFLR